MIFKGKPGALCILIHLSREMMRIILEQIEV
jgi:hypothetical protein